MKSVRKLLQPLLICNILQFYSMYPRSTSQQNFPPWFRDPLSKAILQPITVTSQGPRYSLECPRKYAITSLTFFPSQSSSAQRAGYSLARPTGTATGGFTSMSLTCAPIKDLFNISSPEQEYENCRQTAVEVPLLRPLSLFGLPDAANTVAKLYTCENQVDTSIGEHLVRIQQIDPERDFYSFMCCSLPKLYVTDCRSIKTPISAVGGGRGPITLFQEGYYLTSLSRSNKAIVGNFCNYKIIDRYLQPDCILEKRKDACNSTRDPGEAIRAQAYLDFLDNLYKTEYKPPSTTKAPKKG